MLLALELIEAEPVGAHGIPLVVATDPANQFRFKTALPVVDWAAHTLAADQQTYYDKYDTDKEHPLNRAGHLWGVRLEDSPN